MVRNSQTKTPALMAGVFGLVGESTIPHQNMWSKWLQPENR